MHRAIRVLLAFVVSVGVTACANTGFHSDTKMICGVVDSLKVQGDTLHYGPIDRLESVFDSTFYTNVYFDDGRWVKLVGTPETSVEKGRAVTFTVQRMHNANGSYVLIETQASTRCGLFEGKSDSTKAKTSGNSH